MARTTPRAALCCRSGAAWPEAGLGERQADAAPIGEVGAGVHDQAALGQPGRPDGTGLSWLNWGVTIKLAHVDGFLALLESVCSAVATNAWTPRSRCPRPRTASSARAWARTAAPCSPGVVGEMVPSCTASRGQLSGVAFFIGSGDSGRRCCRRGWRSGAAGASKPISVPVRQRYGAGVSRGPGRLGVLASGDLQRSTFAATISSPSRSSWSRTVCQRRRPACGQHQETAGAGSRQRRRGRSGSCR